MLVAGTDEREETLVRQTSSRSRVNLLRWQIGQSTFGVPQAAAPIAFALLAFPLTGTAESGAGMVLAMTVAQVIAAVPVSRLGRRFNAVHYLRALIAVRTAALAGVTVLAALGAPFGSLVVAVVLAGAVNGAAYGYQRLLLNHLVEPGRLPRALGVAATLNEVTFALSPVLASVLGAFSPVWAMAAITALGLGPLLLMPAVPEARGPLRDGAPRSRQRLSPTVLLWLFCAMASGGAVATVEVGAVSFAVAFGLAPGWAFLFAIALCGGSVAGGIWVSVRNRRPPTGTVAAFLAATTAGSWLLVLGGHLVLTLGGAVVIGFFLPALGTFYSLALDDLAPPHRRAEMFAMLRTATSLGVIVVSGLLAVLGLRATIVGTFVLLATALVLVTALAVVSRERRRAEARTG